MIPLLALIITVLVAFLGPLAAWAVARQQIDVTAREAWLREFRNQVGAFLASEMALRRHAATHSTDDRAKERRLAAINDALSPAYYILKLLFAEKGETWDSIGRTLDAVVKADETTVEARRRTFILQAETILASERESIAADRGVWRALKTALRPPPIPDRPTS